MSWYKKINEVTVGDKIENAKNGKGIVVSKTARTVTVAFDKVTIKNTYKHKDAPFWASEF
jgi:hypothetical protein